MQQSPYELREINVANEEVVIFEPFQRDAVPAHVLWLTENWNPLHVGVIVLAQIHSKAYSVVDGGHRVRGAREVYKGERQILLPAAVVKGLEFPERALLYEAFDHRLQLTPYDRFKSALARGDSTAIFVERQAARCGLKIMPGGRGAVAGELRCAGSLMQAAKLGEAVFERMLRISSEWAARGGEPVTGDIVRALAKHLDLNRDHDADLATALRDWTVRGAWVTISRNVQSGRGGDGAKQLWERFFRDLLNGGVTEVTITV